MDVESLKLYNLQRLAKKFNCDEPAKLGRAIGVSTQHASKLLKGQAGIGNGTIQRFVDAWGIDASEFVAEPRINEKDKGDFEMGGEPNELLVMLVKEQSKRIDEMSAMIKRTQDVVSRYKDEVEKIWGVVNVKDASLQTVNESIREITMRILDIREDMTRAADHKDVSLLKKAAGD